MVSVDVRQDKINILLAALKTAEDAYTKNSNWQAADEIGKLHASLRQQIFEFEKVD